MDRFFRGFTAGVVGGIVMHLWTLVALNILNWETNLNYFTLPVLHLLPSHSDNSHEIISTLFR